MLTRNLLWRYGTGGGPGVYHNATLGLLSFSGDGETWITMADKNLGATQIYNYGDTLSQANCGNFYQWGNNYGFPFTGPTTTSSTKVNTTGYGPGNYYSSSTFITTSSMQENWSTTNNTNLWGYDTGTVEAMQGPCPSGFHLLGTGGTTELNEFTLALGGLGLYGTSDAETASRALLMPLCGIIDNTGTPFIVGEGISWTGFATIVSGIGVGCGIFGVSQYGAVTDYGTPNLGANIRPIKNTPVVPDGEWTLIYRPQ